ncbi:MAG: GNAT family N-acyltransferase [Haliea sp.]|uniref:GNAT family N-acyltransferase n=1 Tax=Haliea sp. TaxID=1932666 RepID=UPI0032EB77D0
MTHAGAFRLANWLHTQVITEPRDLRAIHRLRYRVYCEERAFFSPSDFPDRLESDEFDDYSVHFAAFDQDGEVAAAVRLVCPVPGRGLPFQQHCSLFDGMTLPDQAQAGEVSRLVLNRGYRTPPGGGGTGTVVMEVYRAMYQYSREQGIRYWYAAMERPLLRMLARIGVVFEPIGPEVDYCGPVVPYLLDLEELDRHLAWCNPDLLQWLSSAS